MSYHHDRQQKIATWRIRILLVLIVAVLILARTYISVKLQPFTARVHAIGYGISTSTASVFHEISLYFKTKNSLDAQNLALVEEVENLKQLEGVNLSLLRQNKEYENDLNFFDEALHRQKIIFTSFVSLYGTRTAEIKEDIRKNHSQFVYGPHGGVVGEIKNIDGKNLLIVMITEQTEKKYSVVFGGGDTQYEIEPQKNSLFISKVPQVDGIESGSAVYLVTDKGYIPLGKVVRSDTNPQDPFSTVYISLLDDVRDINRGYIVYHE